MAAQTAQNYANHTRLDPFFHMFVLPIGGLNILAAIAYLVRHPSYWAAWLVVIAIVGAVAIVKIRTYALRVQDRVIRLEERLRLSQLLSEPQRSRIGDLQSRS